MTHASAIAAATAYDEHRARTHSNASLIGFYALAGHAFVLKNTQNRASTPRELVARKSQQAAITGPFSLAARFVLKSSQDLPSLAEFEDAVFQVSAYPRTGQFLGLPVDLFEKSVLLQARRFPGDSAVAYQMTSECELFSVTPRHYVIALHRAAVSADSLTITWQLLPHASNENGFIGEYAGPLNAGRERALYTPTNSGSWTFSPATRTVDFHATVDAGAPVTHPNLFRKALAAFPLALLKDKWGITSFETLILL